MCGAKERLAALQLHDAVCGWIVVPADTAIIGFGTLLLTQFSSLGCWAAQKKLAEPPVTQVSQPGPLPPGNIAPSFRAAPRCARQQPCRPRIECCVRACVFSRLSRPSKPNLRLSVISPNNKTPPPVRVGLLIAIGREASPARRNWRRPPWRRGTFRRRTARQPCHKSSRPTGGGCA